MTDYTAPIGQAVAIIRLPENSFAVSDLEITPYVSSSNAEARVIDNQTFLVEAADLPPQAKLTFAAGWPKGLVSQRAYWWDFARTNWGYLLALLVALGSLLYGFVFWYRTEKYQFGRGTIVPQYEPPQKLKPAMAEVIIKEKITDKAWSATIVDLAVRGYLIITEEKQGRIGKFVGIFLGSLMPILFFLFIFVWFLPFISTFNSSSIFVLLLFFLLFFALPILFSFGRWRSAIQRHDYRIEKTEKVPTDLEDYEKKFLDLLFVDKNYFSTKEFRRRGNTVKQEFVFALRDLQKELYKETERDTKAYVVGPSREGRKRVIWFILFLFLLPFSIGLSASLGGSQYALLILTIIIAGLTLRAFIKYEARLSKEGQILKEDWLGFKLYLATAEKYRLQNLTPDLFEKYLPYAIIFGVEKKWGRAFAHLSMMPPNWYSGVGSTHAGSFSSSSVGFSVSAFSASFSSSFASAFSSSAGGGASGGGGGGGAS